MVILSDLELLSCFKMTVNCFLTKFPKLKFQYFSNASLSPGYCDPQPIVGDESEEKVRNNSENFKLSFQNSCQEGNLGKSVHV